MLSKGEGAFTALPPLSCDKISHAAAVTVEESGSVAGLVLLFGGWTEDHGGMSTVHLVDLAIGVCTPQPNLLLERVMFAAARLPHGCVVYTGGPDGNYETLSSAEILEPSVKGAADATWIWRELPALSVQRVERRPLRRPWWQGQRSRQFFVLVGVRDIGSR
jgi:hypothetical protein